MYKPPPQCDAEETDIAYYPQVYYELPPPAIEKPHIHCEMHHNLYADIYDFVSLSIL
ncbi:hypothetical protein KSX_61130 [Ktedonospora formicarum]|uniref:Uncharacterized protein n=1 Tax=Ktedonospora formicarum TaxID=2778364 RepID=A0A8J3MU86_9CHLR|nr:hypothetical protein KSX_61130 [Ktedonospora formicarum]